jgi:hypothetical protein
MRILTLILLCSVVAHGAEKPVCDANAVTRNCKFFEERKDQPTIKLSDGSYLTNPMSPTPGYDPGSSPYSQYENGGAQGGGGMATPSLEEVEAMQINQADIIDQLAKTPFSTRFKISFAQYAGFFAANPETPVQMLWPPDSKTPGMTLITGTKLFAYMKLKMKPAEYSQLMKLVDVQKAPQVKAAIAMQEQQKQQIAANIKQAEAVTAEVQRVSRKKAKIRELFKYTQDQMIAVIQQGKKDSELTSEQQRQIAKIKSLKLHDLDDPATTSNSTCVSALQNNAFYTAVEHEITFCSGFFSKSDAELVSVMGHEMGHAIDICNSQQPLTTVNYEKVDEFLNRKDITPSEREAVGYLYNSKVSTFNTDLKMTYDSKIVDKLLKAGVLKEEVAGAPYKNYPQFKEFACLSKSSGFRINNASDIVATKRALNRGISEMPAEDRDGLDKVAERYGKALDQYPQCYGTLKGASQAQEASADIFGALILEKYMIDYPPKDEVEKVASVNMWLRGSCNQNGPVLTPKTNSDLISPAMFSNYMSSAVRFESHPDDGRRLKNAYLNLPGLAKMFDCKRTVNTCFDNLSFYNRASSAQKAALENKSLEGVR